MKLQAIKKMCMDTGTFYLINAGKRQWMCNGAAAWPVEGITLAEDGIAAVFDIPPKKQEEIIIRELEYKDPRFSIEPCQGEEQLQEIGRVLNNGNILLVLKSQGGILFINTDYLKPIDSKQAFTYMMRTSEEKKTPLVAVYNDLFCGGLIMPCEGKEIVEELEKICYEPIYDVGGEKQEET